MIESVEIWRVQIFFFFFFFFLKTDRECRDFEIENVEIERLTS